MRIRLISSASRFRIDVRDTIDNGGNSASKNLRTCSESFIDIIVYGLWTIEAFSSKDQICVTNA